MAALTGAALTLGGCTTGMTSQALRDKPLPQGGAPVSDSVWDAAAEVPPNINVGSFKNVHFALPYVKHKQWFQVGAERDTATASRLSYYGLGIRYLHVPLQYSYSAHLYEKGTEAPVTTVKRGLHPLWSWAKVEGQPSADYEVSAGGVPLIADWGHERVDAWYVDPSLNLMGMQREKEYWRTLWNLGPAGFQVRDFQQLPNGAYESHEKHFVPLFLGEIGMLLFNHYRQTASEPSAESTRRGTGPVYGYPLFYQAQRTDWAQEEGGTFSKILPPASRLKEKLLLGGILWYDASRETDGQVQSRSTGPLWGLFGRGVRDGRNVTLLFRIPVGGGSATEN